MRLLARRRFLAKWDRLWPWMTLILLLAVSLGLRQQYVHVKSLDYDEGHWLMFGLLALAGYRPYDQAFVGIPPLALWTIELGAWGFGLGRAVRYPTLLYSLVGIGAIYWLVQRQSGAVKSLAGLLAAAFLSFGPRYFQDSAQIMMEVPSIALSILSLALINQYHYSRALPWLFLSGFVFALSLSLKIFPVFIPILILPELFIIAIERRRPEGAGRLVWASIFRQIFQDGLVWSLGVLLPLALYVLLYDAEAMFRQIIQFRLAIRQTYLATGESTLAENLRLLGEEYPQYVPWLVLAGVGVIAQGKRGLRQSWLWPAWFLLANLVLITHVPMRPRYSVLLFPPLAALSGITIALLLRRLYRIRLQKVGRLPGVTLAGSVGATLFVLVLTGPIQAATSSPQSPLHGRHTGRADGINFIREHTGPDDCIITDDQRFNLLADRLAPPWLSEISTARLATGWVTFDDVAAAIEENDCAATVYVTGRIDGYIPELRNLLRNQYFLELKFDDIDVYAVKKNVRQAPSHSSERHLGPTIRLAGYDVTPTPWSAGQSLALSTYWTTTGPITASYKIFVHFRDQAGQTVLQFDHYPFGGLVPTTAWVPGHTVKETLVVPWTNTLPAGTYRLYLGMYDPETLARLPVQNDRSGENAILLDLITVTP